MGLFSFTSPKKETIDLLRKLSPLCPFCKFYCRSVNITCNSKHEACTIKESEINPLMEINCKDFQDKIRDVNVTITAADGSKIINTVDLVNIFDKQKIKFKLKREGIDLKTGGKGTIEYSVVLVAES